MEIFGIDKSKEKRNRNLERLQYRIYFEPNHVKSHCLIALEYFSIGEIDKAFNECEIALKIEENNPISLRFLGQFYTELGELKEAKKCFNRILSDKHRDKSLFGLSKVAYLSNDLELSLHLIDQVLIIDPGSHNLINKGMLLLELGITKKAREYFLKALNKNPFLLDSRIYQKRQQFSIYPQQSNILPLYSKIKDPKQLWHDLITEADISQYL